MSDLMKYNAIMPRDDDSFYLWYDSVKGFRLNIIGDGNCNFNQEAEVLFQIERERIIKLLSSGEHVWQLDVIQRLFRFSWKQRCRCGFYGVFNDHLIALIKGEN